MTTTFKVCEQNSSFKTKTEKHKYTQSVSSSLTELLKTKLECCSTPEKQLLQGYNKGFLSLVQSSFDEHYPLIIDPDTVWLTIAKGLATHINLNAEKLRKQFVDFEGKVLIEIVRNDFVKGQRNPWENTFPEFSQKIGEYIGKKRDLIVSSFSTTDTMRSLCSDITLMDAMKSYFDYSVSTCCGIPRVTLEGSVEDWKDIRKRVSVFDEFGLSDWTKVLIPILDEFVASAQGNPNMEFWNSFYNEGGGSGGPFISGFILGFYPYFTRNQVNDFSAIKNRHGSHVTSSQIPKPLSNAPFTWNYWGTVFPMEFNGGIIGVEQEDDGSVRSCFGWSVSEACVSLTNFALENFTKGMIINHSDGRVGKLHKAEVQEWHKGDALVSRQLEDVYIVWDGQTEPEHFRRYSLSSLYVKESNSGELIPEAVALRQKGSGA